MSSAGTGSKREEGQKRRAENGVRVSSAEASSRKGRRSVERRDGLEEGRRVERRRVQRRRFCTRLPLAARAVQRRGSRRGSKRVRCNRAPGAIYSAEPPERQAGFGRQRLRWRNRRPPHHGSTARPPSRQVRKHAMAIPRAGRASSTSRPDSKSSHGLRCRFDRTSNSTAPPFLDRRLLGDGLSEVLRRPHLVACRTGAGGSL